MEKIIPIELLKAMDQKYPGAFKMLDETFADEKKTWLQTAYVFGDVKPIWNKEYCYTPSLLAIEYVRDHGMDSFWSTDWAEMAMLSAWRQTKSIYRISKELTHEFLKIGDYIQTSSDLLTIPRYSIYIETVHGLENIDINGIFVRFDNDDFIDKRKELHIIPVRNGKMEVGMCLSIPNEPEPLDMVLIEKWRRVRESIESDDVPQEYRDIEGEEKHFDESRTIIPFVCNVLLYLSNTESKYFQEQGGVNRYDVV